MLKLSITILPSLFFLSFFSVTSAAQIIVSTPRVQYAPSDSIVLTIEADNPIATPLDITPLLTNFIILAQKKMMINSYADGKRSSKARWDLQLRARKSGPLEVPAIQYNEEQSDPITLFIKSQDRVRFLPVTDSPIILDAQLNNDENYEGGLFLYTLSMYSDQPLAQGYQISTPRLQNAEITLLQTSPPEQVEVRNKNYFVYEQHYAIQPKEMGRYVIEGPIFKGSQQNQIRTEVRANNLEINVRARQNYDVTQNWLPATDVKLNQTWEKQEPLRVGDSISREVTLTVNGIAANRLPIIIGELPEIIKVTDSNTTLNNNLSKSGITGVRTETQSLLLLERGEITFPEIKIQWWDTQSDSQQTAVISKQILQVMPGVNGESSIEREQAQNQPEAVEENQPNESQPDASWLIWILAALSSLSIIGWLINRRRAKNTEDDAPHDFSVSQPDSDDLPADNHFDSVERSPLGDIGPATTNMQDFNPKAELNTFQILGRACLKNDAISAQRRLLEWAKNFWYEDEINSVQDIAHIADNASLNVLLAEMEHVIQTGTYAQWQGKSLFHLLTDIRSK